MYSGEIVRDANGDALIVPDYTVQNADGTYRTVSGSIVTYGTFSGFFNGWTPGMFRWLFVFITALMVLPYLFC